jgi:hypothetical protein
VKWYVSSGLDRIKMGKGGSQPEQESPPLVAWLVAAMAVGSWHGTWVMSQSLFLKSNGVFFFRQQGMSTFCSLCPSHLPQHWLSGCEKQKKA